MPGSITQRTPTWWEMTIVVSNGRFDSSFVMFSLIATLYIAMIKYTSIIISRCSEECK